MTRRSIAIGVVLAVAATACGSIRGGESSELSSDTTSTSTSSTSTVATTDTTTSPAAGESATTTTTTTTGSSLVTTSTAPAAGTTKPSIEESEGGGSIVTGDAPGSVIQSVMDAAQTHTGVDRSAMTLLRAQAVTFSDGSLDCPEPGVLYTQALVNGYWIQLEVDGVTLDYRVSDRGGMKLCEGGGNDPRPSQDS